MSSVAEWDQFLMMMRNEYPQAIRNLYDGLREQNFTEEQVSDIITRWLAFNVRVPKQGNNKA